MRRRHATMGAAAMLTALVTAGTAGPALAGTDHEGGKGAASPIKHLVVIYQENVSFDHYFGTYPKAANTSGQPFQAQPGTPAVNGLTADLLTKNPNRSTVDATKSANPRRYDPTNINDVLTCDQGHSYTAEQQANDGGKMDMFPQTVGGKGTTPTKSGPCNPDDVMNYYDGNTVTGLWNYAQHYAMSDNSFSTTFGPSSPGAINLISGNTGSADMAHTANDPAGKGELVADGNGGFSMIGDPQPYWDDCSTRDAVAMTGKNVGDLLNAKGQSWGFFEGGFRPTTSYAQASGNQPTPTFTPNQFKGKYFDKTKGQSDQGICNAAHPVGAGLSAPLTAGNGTNYGYKDDYIPHHQPFQYYASTANPHHLTLPTNSDGTVPASALKTIGTDTQRYMGGAPQFDTPNHQYDMSDFDQLVAAIGKGDLPPSALPAVSFLKAPAYQDGHAAYSDPLDEQQFLVKQINALQRTAAWKDTAVVVAYDDSDGWYDHAYSGVHNPSHSAADALTGPAQCGNGTPVAGQNGRCAYGTRQPLLVISPFSKTNVVDHIRTDQSSILKFVEDNWLGGRRIEGSFDSAAGSLGNMFDFRHPRAAKLTLDPATGAPVNSREPGNGGGHGNADRQTSARTEGQSRTD